MKTKLLIILLLCSWAALAQENLTLRVSLNTAEGAGIEGVSIRINGIGNALTDNDGFAQFTNLKTSHKKTTGDAIRIDASKSGYAVVNNFDIAGYILPKDRSMPVTIILAKTTERDRYAIKYLEAVANISLSRNFETREKELQKQIDKSANDFKGLVNSTYQERQQFQNRIDSLDKQLDFVQKQRLDQRSTAEQIARILANVAETDTLFLKAYKLFMANNYTQAQKVLDASQIDQERIDYLNEEKLAQAHQELAKKKKENYISKCLLKAKLYALEPQIAAAETWYEKAYQADSSHIEMLFDYALLLQYQNRAKRSAELYEKILKISKDDEQIASTLNNLGIFYHANQQLEKAQQAYERALKIYEELAKNNPAQFLPDVAMTLNNLGNLYSDNQQQEKAQQAYERALKIYEELAKNNPAQFLPNVARTQVNFGVFYLANADLVQGEGLLLKGLQNYTNLALQYQSPVFWQKALQIAEYLPDVIQKDSLYTQKLTLQNAIIDFYEVYPKTEPITLAMNYGNAAYYALFCKEFTQAENYARKGLAKDPTQHWIYTNLALALLLQNRWAEAKSTYQDKQNLLGSDKKLLKEAFLSDITDLEKAGIQHVDFEKVRALFR